MDNLTKRLLGLMQLGGGLEGADGHIWIYCDNNCDRSLGSILTEAGICLNNKIYGGVLEALDTIDMALSEAEALPLIKHYSDEIQFLGSPGAAKSRIDKTEQGQGGIK